MHVVKAILTMTIIVLAGCAATPKATTEVVTADSPALRPYRAIAWHESEVTKTAQGTGFVVSKTYTISNGAAGAERFSFHTDMPDGAIELVQGADGYAYEITVSVRSESEAHARDELDRTVIDHTDALVAGTLWTTTNFETKATQAAIANLDRVASTTETEVLFTAQVPALPAHAVIQGDATHVELGDFHGAGASVDTNGMVSGKVNATTITVRGEADVNLTGSIDRLRVVGMEGTVSFRGALSNLDVSVDFGSVDVQSTPTSGGDYNVSAAQSSVVIDIAGGDDRGQHVTVDSDYANIRFELLDQVNGSRSGHEIYAWTKGFDDRDIRTNIRVGTGNGEVTVRNPT